LEILCRVIQTADRHLNRITLTVVFPFVRCNGRPVAFLRTYITGKAAWHLQTVNGNRIYTDQTVVVANRVFGPFRFYGFNTAAVYNKALYVANVTERSEIKPFCTVRYVTEHIITDVEVKIGMAYRHDERTEHTVVFVSEHASKPGMVQTGPSYLLHSSHIHLVAVRIGCGGYDILAYDFTDNSINRIHSGIFHI